MTADPLNGSGIDLALDFPAGRGRRSALEDALREAIRRGRLGPACVLPSSRTLAIDLGVARGTVTAAYEQLMSEGWLVTRPRAATVVAGRRTSPAPSLSTTADDWTWRHDFHPCMPDLAAFPRRAWIAALREALNRLPEREISADDLRGNAGLRAGLIEHLARTRGVVSDPDRVVISSGFTQGLGLVASALRRRGVRAVAMEDPCLPRHRDIVAAHGLEVVGVPVDTRGIRTDLVPTTVGAVVVTPAHHFPLGVPLAPDRRCDLVDRAARHGLIVIEDDYLGEFRYDRKPLGAIHALAPDQVVYGGSAGKALAPGVRLGWLVAPRALVPDMVAAKEIADNGTSALDQIAFAELLRRGTYARHVRRQRVRYRQRRDHLLRVLSERVPAVRASGAAAGMYIVVELPAGSSDQAVVIADAARRGIRLPSIRACWHTRPAPARAFAIGYAAQPDHDFRAAVDALASLLATHASGEAT